MSREAIIRQIVARELAGKGLNVNAVQVQDKSLYEIACEEFGAWETALEYAGIHPRFAASAKQPWSREGVIKQLRRLCSSGYDLGARNNRSRDHALYRATLSYFGSWRAGLIAAGINLSNVDKLGVKKVTREVLLLWLQNRQASGHSLVWTDVVLENRSYALAIKRTFRSWKRALAEAGVE